MYIPNEVKVMGYTIPVEVYDDMFIVDCLDGRRVYAEGHYNVLTNKIRVVDKEDKAIGGTNFLHEVIEVINNRTDIGMNHAQITTLAATLYQSLSPCFKDAA